MGFDTAQRMMNGYGGMLGSFMWFNYLLFLAVTILGIVALLKYINKK